MKCLRRVAEDDRRVACATDENEKAELEKTEWVENQMPMNTESAGEARIVEWNDEKGYGFLGVGQRRVFLHWRDFAERHKRPAAGDVIRFTLGVDAQGRTFAKEAVHVNDRHRVLTSGVERETTQTLS